MGEGETISRRERERVMDDDHEDYETFCFTNPT